MRERLITVSEARGLVPALAKHLDMSPGNAEETVADLIRTGEESLDLLRYRQQCPVCQTGTVGDTAVSCGVDYRCDNPECGEAFIRPQVTVPRPETPDLVENLLRFGWQINRARARWAARQAKS